MQTERKQALRETLAALASSHAMIVEQIQFAIRLITEEIETNESDPLLLLLPTAASSNSPMVDYQTLCVVWNGKRCFLGNTLLFRFFDRIARCPNCYVSYSDLLDDVWGGPREDSSIRGVAKRLRDTLAANDMATLSASIDGSNTGYYGLILV